jgi:hypothetical protein
MARSIGVPEMTCSKRMNNDSPAAAAAQCQAP